LESTTSIFDMIINKECRKLSSGGYKHILKYYKRNFNIDIGSFHPGNRQMEEIHERRHLLVHKLGKTDKAYRKKYNTTNMSVLIKEDYLLETISDLRTFATFLKNQVDYKIKNDFQKPKSSVNDDTNVRIIKLKHPENYEYDFFDSEYEFWAGDEFCKSKSLLNKIIKVDSENTIIEVKGSSLAIKRFLRLIRRKSRSNRFEYKEVKKNNQNESNFSQQILDEELVEKIKSRLPEQPWEKSIHKLVAKELNISNKLCSIGIQQLIANGDFKMQIDGIIIEEEK